MNFRSWPDEFRQTELRGSKREGRALFPLSLSHVLSLFRIIFFFFFPGFYIFPPLKEFHPKIPTHTSTHKHMHMLLNQTILLPIGARVETYPEESTDLPAQSEVSRCRHALRSLKSRPESSVLDLDLCPGLSGLSVIQLVPVPHPGTDTGSPGPCWDKEEQIAFAHVPMMIGIEVSYNSGIPASMGDPA